MLELIRFEYNDSKAIAAMLFNSRYIESENASTYAKTFQNLAA